MPFKSKFVTGMEKLPPWNIMNLNTEFAVLILYRAQIMKIFPSLSQKCLHSLAERKKKSEASQILQRFYLVSKILTVLCRKFKAFFH